MRNGKPGRKEWWIPMPQFEVEDAQIWSSVDWSKIKIAVFPIRTASIGGNRLMRPRGIDLLTQPSKSSRLCLISFLLNFNHHRFDGFWGSIIFFFGSDACFYQAKWHKTVYLSPRQCVQTSSSLPTSIFVLPTHLYCCPLIFTVVHSSVLLSTHLYCCHPLFFRLDLSFDFPFSVFLRLPSWPTEKTG